MLAVVLPLPIPSAAHRPRSPRQNSMGGASPSASSIPSPQTGTAPVETLTSPTSASSPTAASPTPNMVAASSVEGSFVGYNNTNVEPTLLGYSFFIVQYIHFHMWNVSPFICSHGEQKICRELTSRSAG